MIHATEERKSAVTALSKSLRQAHDEASRIGPEGTYFALRLLKSLLWLTRVLPFSRRLLVTRVPVCRASQCWQSLFSSEQMSRNMSRIRRSVELLQ